MIPPLDVDALRAFELRALELHEFARALPGVVIPLGGLVDFISRRRRGILIRLVRTVVGVETTHYVGRDGWCRPLQTLGGPPSPFHPREVRSKVGRYAAARAQMRPEARQFDRYLLGRLGESSESLRLPRPPPGGYATAVDALEPDEGRDRDPGVVSFALVGLPLAQAQLIDNAEGVRPYGGIVLPRDQSPSSSSSTTTRDAAANDGGTAPVLLAAIRPPRADDAVIGAARRPGRRSIVAHDCSPTDDRLYDRRRRRGRRREEERRCASFVLPPTSRRRRRTYSQLSPLGPSHVWIQVHYEIAPDASARRHRSPMMRWLSAAATTIGGVLPRRRHEGGGGRVLRHTWVVRRSGRRLGFRFRRPAMLSLSQRTVMTGNLDRQCFSRFSVDLTYSAMRFADPAITFPANPIRNSPVNSHILLSPCWSDRRDRIWSLRATYLEVQLGTIKCPYQEK
jgi:hypothetical protein